MQEIPIIYIHFGNIPDYLVTSINQAAVYNKKIVLLTDVDFTHDKVECFPIDKFNKDIDAFESVYKHMSTNSAEFEKICIKRWFILRNFVNQNNINVCYYTDSDVMIYENLTNMFETYKTYDAAYTSPEYQEDYRWASSACCSYWKPGAINEFCDFVLSLYSSNERTLLDEKWEFHQSTNTPGGICDMTLLYLFSKKLNFYSLSKVKGQIAFDSNMYISENYLRDEYAMENFPGDGRLIKKITWKNNQPYGFSKITGEQVRFITLTEYAKLLAVDKTWVDKVLKRIKAVIRKVSTHE